VKTRTDTGGHTYSYEYDSLGRLTKVYNPDSTFKQIHYDDTAAIVTVLDENQHEKEYYSGWTGNLLWVKEYTGPANCYLTQYTYDQVGNLISVADAHGNTTFYEYDSLFGLTQITYPDLTTETFTYDASGNVLQRTDSNGTTTFTYNAISQLVDVQYPDQSSVLFEHDFNGNRILMVDSAGQTSYTYDNRNRLISETRTIEGEPYTVNYTYDAVSNLTSVTYPEQSVVTFEYDSANRLTAIPGYSEFTYNTDSLPSTMTYSNSVITTYQYDSNDRPVTVHAQKDGTDLLTMNYQYDSANNIAQLEYGRKKGQDWIQSGEMFTYDWLDRLVSAQGDYGLLSYSYDPVGNRLSASDLLYTYNAMNELLSISDGTTFTYDEMGNTLTKTDSTSTWSYTYDARNRLIQVEKNQHIIAQYSYDGDGRRVQKTEWIEDLQEYKTTIYVHAGLNVLYEKNLNTNKNAIYIYGPMGRIAKKVGELADYYHQDGLGSTRLITDQSGNIVTEVSYEPFGEDTITGEEDSYLYTGKEKDSTGLYYYGARYYDPEIGRFTTRDPLQGKMRSPQTQNRYTYCLNNPLKYIDPQGLDCEYIILPDGTVSHELAALYNSMQQALKSLTEEDWEDIENLLASNDMTKKMEAIKIILTEAEIHFVESNAGKSLTIKLAESQFTIEFKAF